MEKRRNTKGNFLWNCVKVVLLLVLVIFGLKIAPNYIRGLQKNEVSLIINNKNVTKSLKKAVVVDESGVIFLSKEDIQNFFDESIYFDEKNSQIITTYESKIAVMGIEKKEILVNDSKVNIRAGVSKKNETIYLPFSEIEDVYNIELNYIKDSNIIIIDSLDREQKAANSSDKSSVKYLPTFFSKKIDKVQKGEKVIVVDENEEGWVKIRTERGNIGYIKKIANIRNVRDDLKEEKQIEGKVSMVWDYYSEYTIAPNRTGTTIKGINVVSPSLAVLKENGNGELISNVGQAGKQYLKWAKDQNYKVWAMVSNNSLIDTTSKILNDFELRTNLINNLVSLAVQNDLDGINIDFENMYEKDKDMFSRFIIELVPRLKEYGMITSVDVTAPDGAGTWSMCFDRNEISKAADYIVFMAYDQNGATSPKEGTTAGANWVEANIKKFLGQEDVDENKIILGIPFYTRIWKEKNGEVTSSVVSMKNIKEQIPVGTKQKWDEDLKQNYVEYQKDGAIYKIWIEDEKSIEAKLSLMNNYNLGGAAYWAKDRETVSIWDKIEALVK